MPYGKCKDCKFCRTENSTKTAKTCLRTPNFSSLQVVDAVRIAEKFSKEDYDERKCKYERSEAEKLIKKNYQILLLEQYEKAVNELKTSEEYKTANIPTKGRMSRKINKEFEDKGLICHSIQAIESRFQSEQDVYPVPIHKLFYTYCTRHSVFMSMYGGKKHELAFPEINLWRVMDGSIGCGEFETFKKEENS